MHIFNALIIEDEKPARDLIKSFLFHFDQIRVVGEAENGFDGCKMINNLKPDLVFLDIKMPKLSGLELLDLLEHPLPYIIFSTAYDQYAVQAFEKNAVDYLLKPYNRDRFNQAIEKFLSKPVGRPLDKLTKRISDFEVQGKILERIPVRSGSKILIIKIEDIQFITAEDDYVKIVANQGNYLKQVTMNYLERSLPDHEFIRIHRSYILNINYLKQFEKYDKHGFMAVLADNIRLPVSRTGVAKLKKVINLD